MNFKTTTGDSGADRPPVTIRQTLARGSVSLTENTHVDVYLPWAFCYMITPNKGGSIFLQPRSSIAAFKVPVE